LLYRSASKKSNLIISTLPKILSKRFFGLNLNRQTKILVQGGWFAEVRATKFARRLAKSLTPINLKIK